MVHEAPRPVPRHKTPDLAMISASQHISSYPTVESHYCRESTKIEYLHSELSITKMYAMYRERCDEGFIGAVSEAIYRCTFCTEFNLSFHKPSKDQCDACTIYGMIQEPTAEQREVQKNHQERKQEARDAKAADKAAPGVLAVCFDLMKVFNAPKLAIGKAYYKRKLAVYNLTFFNLNTSQGRCYVWHKGVAGRGANEISTCVIKYLRDIDEAGEHRHVVLYSDTCGGQNRNRIVITAITSFLQPTQFTR